MEQFWHLNFYVPNITLFFLDFPWQYFLALLIPELFLINCTPKLTKVQTLSNAIYHKKKARIKQTQAYFKIQYNLSFTQIERLRSIDEEKGMRYFTSFVPLNLGFIIFLRF